MGDIVTFYFESQVLEVYVDYAEDNVPLDATPTDIRDIALDKFEMNMHYDIREA